MKSSSDVSSTTTRFTKAIFPFPNVRGRKNKVISLFIRISGKDVRELGLRTRVQFLDGSCFEIEFSRVMNETSEDDLWLMVQQCYVLNQFPFKSGVDFQIALSSVGDEGFTSYVVDQL